MKFKFNYSKKPKVSVHDAVNYSHGDYECRFVMQTMKGQPVAIFKNTTNDVWKVQYGFSTLIFESYIKAMDYCKSHFYDEKGKKIK